MLCERLDYINDSHWGPSDHRFIATPAMFVGRHAAPNEAQRATALPETVPLHCLHSPKAQLQALQG